MFRYLEYLRKVLYKPFGIYRYFAIQNACQLNTFTSRSISLVQCILNNKMIIIDGDDCYVFCCIIRPRRMKTFLSPTIYIRSTGVIHCGCCHRVACHRCQQWLDGSGSQQWKLGQCRNQYSVYWEWVWYPQLYWYCFAIEYNESIDLHLQGTVMPQFGLFNGRTWRITVGCLICCSEMISLFWHGTWRVTSVNNVHSDGKRKYQVVFDCHSEIPGCE